MYDGRCRRDTAQILISHPGTRARVVAIWVGIACLISSGCASVTRTPLESFSASPELRNVPVALIDVIVVPPEPSHEDERRALSLPDEFLVKKGERWTLSPSPIVLPIGDTLLPLLRHAGLNATGYPSLAAASRGGAKVAIFMVVRRASVAFDEPGVFAGSGKAEATIEVDVSMIQVATGGVLWRGPLASTVEMSPGVRLAKGSILGIFGSGVAVTAVTPAGEATAQSARVLLVQAYYHLSLKLAAALQEVYREAS